MAEWMIAWEAYDGSIVRTWHFDTRGEAIGFGKEPKPLGAGQALVLYRVSQEYAVQEGPDLPRKSVPASAGKTSRAWRG